jgi:nucleoside-diphosphate-sugar epimerase
MYLITGGAGFIGSNLAEALVRDGERVRILDNFTTGSMDHLKGFRDRIDIVEGDIRDYELVKRAMKDVVYVSHQAALRSVERSVDDPLSSDEVNTHGTLQILMAARDAKTVKRVVYASSSSVYGDNETLPKTEDLTPVPVSPYAVSKLAGENYCRVFTKLYGLETVSLRYFNVYGPRQSPESKYAAVVPLFMQAALRNEPLEVHGDGEQSRDFTYIDSVVEANRLSCTQPNIGGAVFNIACGERHSLLDIARIVGKFVGRDLPRKHTASRRGDVRHTLASIDRARKDLGFAPKITFEDGLRKTFDALKATL